MTVGGSTAAPVGLARRVSSAASGRVDLARLAAAGRCVCSPSLRLREAGRVRPGSVHGGRAAADRGCVGLEGACALYVEMKVELVTCVLSPARVLLELVHGVYV